MPTGEGFIGNATGGIGQGLAYVLPANKSEDYAMQLAQQHSQQLAVQAAAKLKRQQDLQDTLHKEFIDQKLPDFYAPYDKAIADANKDWQTKATNYSVQTGKSPFTNPELMAEYNKNVIGLAKRSKDLGENISSMRARAIADNGDKYTDESITNVLDYENMVKKAPMAALNVPVPQLKLRPVTAVEFDKTVTPTPIKTNDGNYDIIAPNLPAIKKQVYENAISDPKFAPLLTSYGYNPSIPDFPVYDKEGKRVWYTNNTFLDKTAADILAKPNADQLLADMNINPADPMAAEALKHQIKMQNQAMGRFVTERADNIAAKVATDNTKVYVNEDQAMSRRRLKLAEDAAGREWGRYNEWLKTKDGDSKFLEAVVNKDPEAVSEFEAHIKDIGGAIKPVKNETVHIDGKDIKVTDGLIIDVPINTQVQVYKRRPDNNEFALDKEGNKIPLISGGKPAMETKTVSKRYLIEKANGKASQIMLNDILSKSKNYGAQKSSKAVEFNGASQEDEAALQWLKSNPKAPQAGAIRKSLISKGLIK